MYAHVGLIDVAGAVNALPDFGPKDTASETRAEMPANGQRPLALPVALPTVQRGHLGASGGNSACLTTGG